MEVVKGRVRGRRTRRYGTGTVVLVALATSLAAGAQPALAAPPVSRAGGQVAARPGAIRPEAVPTGTVTSLQGSVNGATALVTVTWDPSTVTWGTGSSPVLNVS